MTRRRLFWLLFVAALLVGLGGPILAIMSCEGWNEGSMAVQSCSPDSALLHDIANLALGFLLISSFMLGVPILIYLGVIWFGCFCTARIAGWLLKLPARRV